MKRTIVVGLMVALTGLLACNKGSEAGSSGGAAASGGDTDSVGVKECDDYIKMWNDCYKDPASKAAAKPGLDATVKAWKDAAKEPATKAGLATSCKMMIDNFPKAACH
jgi:hypothetical protein